MRRVAKWGLLWLACIGAAAGQEASRPLTRAEASGWRETSRHEDVLSFLDALAALPFGQRLHRESIGSSAEGRDLPLVIARGPDPGDDRAKLRILVNANIHAGEVEGKEAVQILLRELAEGRHADLLDHVVLLFVPNFNPDGNDRISPENRVSQNGPDGGVGRRPNAMDLDLNRDFIKAESPECRALLGVFRRFDPHYFLDLHTTNGSSHGYHLTYAPSLSTNIAPELDRFMRQDLLPEVTRSMEETHGFRAFHYGNFPRGNPELGWYTYDHRPRFGTNYYGLRNRLSVVSEAFSYRPFEQRVRITRAFVLENLRAAVRHRETIRRLCAEADAAALDPRELAFHYQTQWAEPSPGEIIVGRMEAVELPDGLGRRMVATEEYAPRTIPVSIAFHSAAKRSFPFAWAIVDAPPAVVENLLLHGIAVERTLREATVALEVFRPAKITRDPNPFQGHRTVQLEGDWAERTDADLPAGTVIVRASQRLSRLAAQLLEPLSEDSLATWNLFDDRLGLDGGGEQLAYPVRRLLTAPGVETVPCETAGSDTASRTPVERIAIVCDAAGQRAATNAFETDVHLVGHVVHWERGGARFETLAQLSEALGEELDGPVIVESDPAVAFSHIAATLALLRERGLRDLRLETGAAAPSPRKPGTEDRKE